MMQTQHGFPDLIEFVKRYVEKESGIILGPKQDSMIYARLSRRMLDLGLTNPRQYQAHFQANLKDEGREIISLMTTHHTFFFREFSQVEFLLQGGLQDIITQVRSTGRKKLRVWSLACSRGQEVYTLAMFLDYQLSRLQAGLDFEILGTDIDHQSLDVAKNGVYKWDEVKEIPAIYLNKHWARGTGTIADFCKVKDSLKSKCTFKEANLFKLDQTIPPDQKFDLMLCRNVLIYFSEPQIKQVADASFRRLEPWGIFLTGVSEALDKNAANFCYEGNSIYRHKNWQQASAPAPVPTVGKTLTPSSPMPSLLNVLCVDDSATILTLLSAILTKEHGFCVVGTAKDGHEAKRQLAAHPETHLMTLDIHMPELDGIGYLSNHFHGKHPAVVMVSSISREENALAAKALSLGASDYIEKPKAQDLAIRAEEIRNKLRAAFMAKSHANSSGRAALPITSAAQELSRSFARTRPQIFHDPDSFARVILGSVVDLQRLMEPAQNLWSSQSIGMPSQQPATLIQVHDAQESQLNAWAQHCRAQGWNVERSWPSGSWQTGHLYLLNSLKGLPMTLCLPHLKQQVIKVILKGAQQTDFDYLERLMSSPLFLEEPANPAMMTSKAICRVIPLISLLHDANAYLLSLEQARKEGIYAA